MGIPNRTCSVPKTCTRIVLLCFCQRYKGSRPGLKDQRHLMGVLSNVRSFGTRCSYQWLGEQFCVSIRQTMGRLFPWTKQGSPSSEKLDPFCASAPRPSSFPSLSFVRPDVQAPASRFYKIRWWVPPVLSQGLPGIGFLDKT